MLSRKKDEWTYIGDDPDHEPQGEPDGRLYKRTRDGRFVPVQVKLMTVDIRADKVRTGYAVDDAIPVHRLEVLEAIRRQRKEAAGA